MVIQDRGTAGETAPSPNLPLEDSPGSGLRRTDDTTMKPDIQTLLALGHSNSCRQSKLMLAEAVLQPTRSKNEQATNARVVTAERLTAAVMQSDVAAAASGDRRAFAKLYRAHIDRVYSLCSRMLGDAMQAEEVTQDVFVRAWEKLPQFRSESSFGTWLHRVAVNVVLSHRKRVGIREKRTINDDTTINSATSRPVSVPDKVDLEAAIADLPEGARTIFVLHDIEGFTHEEIGTQLGITAGGSKAQLHRARMLLRASLAR